MNLQVIVKGKPFAFGSKGVPQCHFQTKTCPLSTPVLPVPGQHPCVSLQHKDTAPDFKDIVGANDHGLGLHLLCFWRDVFWVPERHVNVL